MDLQTLRTEVRDLLSEDSSNLIDSTLNTLIERATQRIEADFADDYGPTPRQMLSSISRSVGSSGLQLPADLLRVRSVTISSNVYRYVAPELLPQSSSNSDSAVNLVYYKRIDKLENDADSNWLLDVGSRVYIYATAIEYCLWNREHESERARYADEYTNSLEKTARSNSSRPSGGFGRARGYQHGVYSIINGYIVFGKNQACGDCVETESEACVVLE